MYKVTYIIIYKKGPWEPEKIKEFAKISTAERFADKQHARGWKATFWERTQYTDSDGKVWVDVD